MRKTSSNLTLFHILWVEETWDTKFLLSQLESQTVVLKDVFWPGLKVRNSPKKDKVLKIFKPKHKGEVFPPLFHVFVKKFS